jgi:predicted amidophosphoribosyltransferase
MNDMPCSITDDPLNDYSHWYERTGPYAKLPHLKNTLVCEGCYQLVDKVHEETGYCEECLREYQEEQFYKHAADNEWGVEL